MVALLYQLQTGSNVPALPESNWKKEVDERWCFPGCRHFIPGRPTDVVVKEKPKEIPLNFLASQTISIALKEFLFDLCPNIEDFAELGSVRGPNNTNFSDFVTFRSKSNKSKIYIRGGKDSQCFICKSCCQLFYTWVGKGYVLEHELSKDNIFLTYNSKLLIEENLLKRFRKWSSKKSNKLIIYQRPILKEPRDGLPRLIEDFKPGVVPVKDDAAEFYRNQAEYSNESILNTAKFLSMFSNPPRPKK